MSLDVLLILVGLVCVAKGGDLFVDSSVRIARALRVPRMVVGGTLVSLATTMPELIVSATASWLGDSGIALGNAVGSAIANIGLILGTVALVARVEVDLAEFRRRSAWMAGAALLVIAFSWTREMSPWAAACLIAVAAAYLYLDLRGIQRHRRADLEADAAAAEVEGAPSIVGVSGTLHSLTLTRFTQWYSYPWLLAFIAVIVAMLGRRGALERGNGLVLIWMYALYVGGLVTYPVLTAQ